MFELSSYNHEFRTKENFYKFHSKNNYYAFKSLFQIFLIYEFPFRKTGEYCFSTEAKKSETMNYYCLTLPCFCRKIVQKRSFRGVLLKKIFLKISQNSQGNACARASS